MQAYSKPQHTLFSYSKNINATVAVAEQLTALFHVPIENRAFNLKGVDLVEHVIWTSLHDIRWKLAAEQRLLSDAEPWQNPLFRPSLVKKGGWKWDAVSCTNQHIDFLSNHNINLFALNLRSGVPAEELVMLTHEFNHWCSAIGMSDFYLLM